MDDKKHRKTYVSRTSLHNHTYSCRHLAFYNGTLYLIYIYTLYIIGRFCLSRKMSTLPNCLKSTSTSTSRSVFMVFHGSRLGCHSSRSVFMVFHGARLVFHGFPWFQVGFNGFS